MANSRIHHYIPQFLIRNFTNDDGFLFVYNKVENKFIDKKSPKGIFFENERNSLKFSGDEHTNDLEEFYGELENKFAPHLKNVITNKCFSPEELVSVVLLATSLKWRSINKDIEFNELKELLTATELGIKITAKSDNVDVNQYIEDSLLKSEDIKKSMRILLALRSINSEYKLHKIHNNSFIESNKDTPSLIGDCGIIEKENSDYKEIEDFIFSLSSSDAFIFKKGCTKQIKNPLFWTLKDLATIHLSKKYIACRHKEHLERMVKKYLELKEENKTQFITKYIFDYIE